MSETEDKFSANPTIGGNGEVQGDEKTKEGRPWKRLNLSYKQLWIMARNAYSPQFSSGDGEKEK